MEGGSRQGLMEGGSEEKVKGMWETGGGKTGVGHRLVVQRYQPVETGTTGRLTTVITIIHLSGFLGWVRSCVFDYERTPRPLSYVCTMILSSPCLKTHAPTRLLKSLLPVK